MTVMRIAHPALLLAASLLHCCDAKPFQCIFKVDGARVNTSGLGPRPAPGGSPIVGTFVTGKYVTWSFEARANPGEKLRYRSSTFQYSVYGVLVGPAKPLPGTGGQVVRGTGNLAPLIVLPNDGINGTNYNVIITQSPGYWAPNEVPKGSAASYNIRTWGYVPLDAAGHYRVLEATFTAPDGKDYTCGGKWLFKQRPLPPIILPLKQG